MSLANFKNEILVRVYIVTAVVVCVAVAIFARATVLATVQAGKWRELADKRTVQMREIPGERGNILAEDGSLLATSVPYFDLYWDASVTSRLPDEKIKYDFDTLSQYIAKYLAPGATPGAWYEYLWNCRRQKARYAEIAKGVPYDTMEMVKKNFPIFKLGQHKGGLIVVRDNRRIHPFKMLALRTLGYTKDDIAVGLEGKFNKDLSGNAQRIPMMRIAGDSWVPLDDLTDIEPRYGNDILTTIDVNTQDIAQTALIRSLDAFQAEHGTAIVMEVKTGKIKAIANLNKSQNGGWAEEYNYAMGQVIEPGSTWKLASMLALLEDNYVRLSDTVDIEQGVTRYFNETLEDHEKTNERLISVKKAFANSSNVGISKLVYNAYKDKPAQYIKHLNDFLLTVPTGIELEGEPKPYIKTPNDATWSGVTLPWMSIGYELQVTPLQLLTFYNAVANNGQMMKPYLVNEIQSYGDTKKRFAPTIINKRVASPQSIAQARELLEAVVEFGTAASMRTPQYRFAGKTGTAQLNYGKNKTKAHLGGYQASFVGYFPAEDPIYSCIIVISKPKAGFYGGIVAAPVFREIADKLMASNVALSVPLNEKGKPVPSPATLPDDAGFRADLTTLLKKVKLKHELIADDKENWVILRAASDTLKVLPRGVGNEKIIPSVVGFGLKDALFLLENRGLKVVVSGYGKVVAQSIQAGQPAVRGQSIAIKLE